MAAAIGQSRHGASFSGSAPEPSRPFGQRDRVRVLALILRRRSAVSSVTRRHVDHPRDKQSGITRALFVVVGCTANLASAGLTRLGLTTSAKFSLPHNPPRRSDCARGGFGVDSFASGKSRLDGGFGPSARSQRGKLLAVLRSGAG